MIARQPIAELAATGIDEALLQFLYQAPMGLVQTTLDGSVTLINAMAAQLLMPLAPHGNLDNLFDLMATAAPGLRRQAHRVTEAGAVVCDDLRLNLPSGAIGRLRGQAPHVISVRLLRLDALHFMASVSDVTAHAQQEEHRLAQQLRDASRIDPLTLLPNRPAVREHLAQALSPPSAQPEGCLGLLLINMDRFKQVNLTQGSGAGDELLRKVAERLCSQLRHQGSSSAKESGPEALVARLGGDEFVVMLRTLRQATDADSVAVRLLAALCEPFSLGNTTAQVTFSMGVVTHSETSHPVSPDADSLLQDASLAMREAKRRGGARSLRFDPTLKQRMLHRSQVEAELREALSTRQLFVVYQPIVSLNSAATDHMGSAGVEALVRWLHPVRGLMPPMEFIDIAEETGLIGALGLHVLNNACQQFMQWHHQLAERAPQVLSVNLSRAQLMNDAIVNQVESTLATHQMPGHRLQLEVTESLAAQDEQVRQRLVALKQLGIAIALDDFGTGYSSLASLHLLPIDVVKIDRSFVSQAESSAHHRVLIEATVRVAQSLGLQTVAEGVETPRQAAILAELQCNKAQGYHFARPLAAEQATAWLQGH